MGHSKVATVHYGNIPVQNKIINLFVFHLLFQIQSQFSFGTNQLDAGLLNSSFYEHSLRLRL